MSSSLHLDVVFFTFRCRLLYIQMSSSLHSDVVFVFFYLCFSLFCLSVSFLSSPFFMFRSVFLSFFCFVLSFFLSFLSSLCFFLSFIKYQKSVWPLVDSQNVHSYRLTLTSTKTGHGRHTCIHDFKHTLSPWLRKWTLKSAHLIKNNRGVLWANVRMQILKEGIYQFSRSS